jgi:hypothetical protein
MNTARPLPSVVTMTLGSSDLKRTEDVLGKAPIDVRRNGKSLSVAPADACGVTIEFVEV